MPIIAPNNTTGLYGIDTTVQINNAVTGNSLNIQGNATITGNLAVGGILTDNYYYANGTPFDPAGTYSNVDVAAFLASGTLTTNITTTANVSGQYILGDGSLLTGLPATYGNANVSTYLASGTNTANMVTTGNIAGTFFLGNGSQLTGIQANYANANVTSLLANFGSNTINTTGNITGGNITGTHVGSGAALTSITGANVTGTVANATFATTAGSSGSATTALTAGTVTTAAQPNITSVGTLTSLSSSGNITGANVTGAHFGSGAGLSNLTGANVTGTVANATFATSAGTAGTVTTAAQPNITSVGTLTSLSSSGNITGANINGAHFGSGAGLSNLTGANVTGTVANATFATSAGTATSATTAATVTTAAQPNITSVGTLTSLSVSGNITGGNISTAGTFSAASLSASGNITGANINATTLLTAPTITTTGSSGNISNVNYITASYFVGDGSLLTNLPGGSYGNSNVVALLNSYGPNTISTTGNITALNLNITNTTGKVSVAGMVQAGNIETTGYISAGTFVDAARMNATGNIVAGGLVVALGNVVGSNVIANNAVIGTTVSATGNITGGNVNTGVVSATGNISTSAFFVGDGSQLTNLPGGTPGGSNTQVQFNNSGSFAGDSLFAWNTSNASLSVGNVRVQDNNIRSVNAWDANTTPQQARITMGTGYDGDFSNSRDPVVFSRGSQLAIINKQNIGNADINQAARGLSTIFFADMNGATLTNGNRRMSGGSLTLAVGNGTQQVNAPAPVYATAAGGGGSLQVGNITLSGVSTFPTGSTSLSHGTGALNTALVGGNATVGNLICSFNQIQFFTNNTGNVRTGIGTSSNFTSGFTGQAVPGNVYGYYMPGTATTHGVSNSNFWRVADNYYFLMNEDDVAQNRLGSLRRYHTYSFVAGSSGTVNIDKNNGQAQYIAPTGNVTIGAFQNFVTSASDSVNTDFQNDTVTVVVNQGATPYTVTMPTGNSSIRYSGGVSTVSSTANSVSTITITAYNNGSGSVYFVNIATTDAATTPAAGDSISPLMLMGG
jgi:hypothetical protein